MEQFQEKVNELFAKHETLLSRKNIPLEDGNGIFTRYQHPVLTAAHTPIFWRYDLNEKTNPYLMERIGMNATMNSGAIKWNGKYLRRSRKPERSRQFPFLGLPGNHAGRSCPGHEYLRHAPNRS